MSIRKIMSGHITEPWLIRPSDFQALYKEWSGRSFLDEWLGLEETDPVLQVENGIAIIPIYGCLGKGLAEWEKSFGGVDVDDISYLINDAANRADVHAILLDISSPGGTVSGIPELGQQIVEARASKPVIAYTDDMACSAGYWIAASAHAIYSTPSAVVGSIGVYLPVLDSSGYYEQLGLKVNVFTSGAYKAAGLDGTQLSDAQKAEFQRGVDFLFGQFADHVKANRPQVSEEQMQGQDFHAADPAATGLIDEIATYDQALNDLRTLADNQR